MKPHALLISVLIFLMFNTPVAHASGEYQVKHKSAVVLAMFGTTVETALDGLISIQKKLKRRFPETEVRIAFTSNMIRKKWQRRAKDPAYRTAHPEIGDEILYVKTPLATIADLQNDGYNSIVLQPTHVSMGEEFLDLHTYVNALMAMGTVKKVKYKPFRKIALGRPLLGTYGTKFPYFKDIETLARAMAPDAALAASKKAGIVYMGHGNAYFPGSGGAYLEFAAKMRQLYPDVTTVIGTVEGFPGIEDVMERLTLYGIKKVVLKPFMVVAGDHSLNDMAGHGADSWKSILIENGFDVIAVTEGLGENSAVADIFVNHAADAARDAGIDLN